ncbi:hypothetical protein SPHINGO8BC_70042 [Sphingobacterium multivorum]|uniref:Uncharacterized protein n=1 Tax=Sphingobacterium multivorum TaxID=28454 RepID=A0A654DMA3_SPHMU|nr:hypothetical protein SPHINGO8BC_70042 [Sphingobacterium multivorum]
MADALVFFGGGHLLFFQLAVDDNSVGAIGINRNGRIFLRWF